MEFRITFLGLISLYFILLSSNVDALRRGGLCPWVYHKDTNCLKIKFLCENGACIDRELYCESNDDCGDNSDEKDCRYDYHNQCPPGKRQCRGSGEKNIPYYWYCDGMLDCKSGEDEDSCEQVTGNENLIKKKALHWLSMQKQSQLPAETRASFLIKSAIAFYLADDTWITRDDEIRREMAYEVSIQLLSRLSKSKLRDIPSSDLAAYVNAFLVTCVDPRKFHGLDIVQELRTRVDNQNYTDPYLLLSLCNAGETITATDERNLIDAFWLNQREFFTDIRAVALMALACAREQPGNEVASEELPKLLVELKKHQYINGSAENLQATALVMQAVLSATPDEDPEIFDENKALQHIFASQKSDGSFGSFMDTYYVLPVLNCKSLMNIRFDRCESSKKSEISALQDLMTYRSGPKIRVRYSIWIENDKDLERYLALRVPANMSLHGIMKMAADLDTRFRFTYVTKKDKPYVIALFGIKNDPEKDKFWFLYTIVEGKVSLLHKSPADVVPKENEHFVMWYRSGSSAH